ncbi:carbon-nitrogen hydrolase family protein [Streptomyces sp. SP18CS02]|uniref:carbon-nitrogen hydrolase family protein n=1 Tax=Streptomyces sp. SP18CS02 TaxID=3002531 RepID=UPI002E76BCA5|nr:carbon-nitrogen hydrolase family protein [Streptomyces sp. SP18CS02]MEE1754252.1 carbon-nitrogen hydrolase family protein [Streptomyces sp. SP18CS02]
MPLDQLPSRVLRVAAAQACPVAGDVDANVSTVAAMVRRAAASGVRVVVFPEKFLSGYEPDLVRAEPERCAVRTADGRLAPVREACRETGTVAVVGAAVQDAGELYVSALVIGSDGELVARYDKQTLFATERVLYRQGAAGCTLEVDGWRLGLGICYDSGFPEHARAAALDGCHAYVVGALFGVGNGYHESRMWFPARAFDNTVYTLLANHVGTTGGWRACGGSAVWGPDGLPVAEGGAETTELVVADLDPGRLREVREAHTMLRDLHDTASAPRARYRVGPPSGR